MRAGRSPFRTARSGARPVSPWRARTSSSTRGIFLSVLGFGTGNYKDSTLEALADKGNGNYAYIDRLKEAQKVLVEQVGSTLVTIAKDVKIQVEFNPARVAEYRLIGYENRALRDEDFNDDRKDAGEIGAGHTVTALYELVLVGNQAGPQLVDDLKYQRKPDFTAVAGSGELLTLKLRYKHPEGDTSCLLAFPVEDAGHDLASASEDFTFAAAVASFGMILQRSEHAAGLDLADVANMARAGKGRDTEGYRTEFMELIQQAQRVVSRSAKR
jgi:Ca-activated chloride channel family protein